MNVHHRHQQQFEKPQTTTPWNTSNAWLHEQMNSKKKQKGEKKNDNQGRFISFFERGFGHHSPLHFSRATPPPPHNYHIGPLLLTQNQNGIGSYPIFL